MMTQPLIIVARSVAIKTTQGTTSAFQLNIKSANALIAFCTIGNKMEELVRTHFVSISSEGVVVNKEYL